MGKKQAESNRTAREKAAAARAEAQAAEKRRRRMVNIGIGAGIAVIVVAIIGGAWWSSQQVKVDAGVVSDPTAAAPVGAFPADGPTPFGIPTGTNPDAPVLEVWEDFQCPACAAFENVAGANLRSLAEQGTILLVSRPTTFLDRSLGTDSSRRATAAYGCAVDAGVGDPYKQLVFANQPTTEGDGWTDQQLIDFGTQAGVSEADFPTFEQCFVDRTYLPWANNSTDAFFNEGINGTPTVVLNGTKLDNADVVDPAKLQSKIDELAGQ